MASSVFREIVNTPKQLYKLLMRACEKLPAGPQEFYKNSIRQSFKQYIIEPDLERVRQLMDKAVYDAKWVMKKYKVDISTKTKKN